MTNPSKSPIEELRDFLNVAFNHWNPATASSSLAALQRIEQELTILKQAVDSNIAIRRAIEQEQERLKFELAEADFGYGGWQSREARKNREIEQLTAALTAAQEQLAEAKRKLAGTPVWVPGTFVCCMSNHYYPLTRGDEECPTCKIRDQLAAVTRERDEARKDSEG